MTSIYFYHLDLCTCQTGY